MPRERSNLRRWTIATAVRVLATVVLVAGATGLSAAAPPAARASDLVAGSVNRSTVAMSASYDVHARLGWASRSIAGTVVITARNGSGVPVDRVRLNTVMGPLGSLRLGTVTVDGARQTPSVSGQTITVPFGGILPAGGSVVIRVPFSGVLRSATTGSSWLFTRANGVADLYRWVPWISRAHPFARPNHGDPFVTPVASTVTLTLRTDVPLAVTVNAERVAVSEDGLVTTWRAANVRDLVVNAARRVDRRSTTVDGTPVRIVARPGGPAAALLRAATTALARLEARLGPFPYPALQVVESAGGFGMEGPGIVWIPTGTETWRYPYLLTHEIAHQWFYGLVGNDQASDPFADEAMADMVARFVLGMRRASRCATAPLDRSIYRYSSSCYYEVVYIQGGNLLDNARKAMGTTAFFAAVRGYLDAHRWGLVRTRTLLDALDAATPLDLAAGWKPRFPSLY